MEPKFELNLIETKAVLNCLKRSMVKGIDLDIAMKVEERMIHWLDKLVIKDDLVDARKFDKCPECGFFPLPENKGASYCEMCEFDARDLKEKPMSKETPLFLTNVEIGELGMAYAKEQGTVERKDLLYHDFVSGAIKYREEIEKRMKEMDGKKIIHRKKSIQVVGKNNYMDCIENLPLEFHVNKDEDLLSIYNRLLELKDKTILFKSGNKYKIYDVSIPIENLNWGVEKPYWGFYIEFVTGINGTNISTKKIHCEIPKTTNDWKEDFKKCIGYVYDPHPFIHFSKENIERLNKYLENGK